MFRAQEKAKDSRRYRNNPKRCAAVKTTARQWREQAKLEGRCARCGKTNPDSDIRKTCPMCDDPRARLMRRVRGQHG